MNRPTRDIKGKANLFLSCRIDVINLAEFLVTFRMKQLLYFRNPRVVSTVRCSAYKSNLWIGGIQADAMLTYINKPCAL